ncbi:MAG: hypothetical protein EPN43_03330 [Jatrophihabitans sp.]|nr:MAG: hypothetical protein EPN43_03330 [Jatrophihabitans sp.]
MPLTEPPPGVRPDDAGADPVPADLGEVQASASAFGFVGALVLVAGLLPVLIAITSASWFTGVPVNVGDKVFLSPLQPTYDQVATLISRSSEGSGLAGAYFGWLAWAMLGLLFACALAALVPSRVRTASRVIAPAVAVAAIVVTTLSLELVNGGDFSFWWRLRGTGYWLAVAGFAVMGVGAALGPVGGARLHAALTGGAR